MTEEINTGLLTDVEEIIEGNSNTHGDPERNFQNIGDYWTLYLQIENKLQIGEELTRSDVSEMMDLLKFARGQTGAYNDDDYRDRIAYTIFSANYKNE
jgi:hypothetical protein